MMNMPIMSHAVVFAPFCMYLCAPGSSSWQTMKTITADKRKNERKTMKRESESERRRLLKVCVCM